MNDQISFLPLLDDAEHHTWLLSGRPGIKNDCDVYTGNVMEFSDGKLAGVNIRIELCAVEENVLFEFSYQAKTYGCGRPLCEDSHTCHRSNSAKALADYIYNVFQHSVVPYDKDLANYPNETKELLKLCKKSCERIAKEVA